MNRLLGRIMMVAMLAGWASPLLAQTYNRTWYYMTTGNGHGFQVFDRQVNRITTFLDHPYRYLAPGDDGRTWGIGRRNLTHDIYFGIRVGSQTKWINKCGSSDCVDYSNVEYEQQSHIIHGTTSFQSAQIDTYFFAPFGYPGNAMLMLVRVQNSTASAMNVSLFVKPNLKLGLGRVEPNDSNEQIQWLGSDATPHGEETGPGGGHALTLPIGGITHASCGTDSSLYNTVLQGGAIGDTHSCNGTAQVLAFQQDLTLAAGETGWWGAAILFLDDNPNDPRAYLFKDDRSISDILTAWSTFAGAKDAKTLHDEALAEFESWRKNTAPTQLNDTEKTLWRQSEAVLRMGQVLEKPGKNFGMVLASLPIGEWHTGWVRDGTYAIAALAMIGHFEEARLGIEFMLGTDSGFFSAGNYLARDYRISTCRYFGNGMEEGDFNQDGPNIETDGWGLVLWVANMYLQYSCDLAWLDQPTWKGDTVFEALHQIAMDIEQTSAGNLPGPDASIWEIHWNRRQVFSYTTAAQIRGLFDFADIAAAHQEASLATHYRTLAQNMLDTAKTALVHQPTHSFASHLGVAGNDVHVDGSTVGFLDWHLIDTADERYTGTLTQFSKLLTGFGGYRRLEPQLSLTGSGSASEYDLSEWILLDLRIGDCWRRMGNATQADNLLHKVTGSAAANDFQVPELFNPDNGRFAGVVPMVGYGAGAWMVSQLEKYNASAPGINVGFDHCLQQACQSNSCPGEHQVCKEDGQGGFTCECLPGYHKENELCVEDTVCNSRTTCSGHGGCTGNGLECECFTAYTGPHCENCNQGFHPEGDSCVEDATCTPNPCTESHKTKCVEQGGNVLCQCDDGYIDNNGTCVRSGDGGTLDDGPASLCASGGTQAIDWLGLGLLGILLVRLLTRTGGTRNGSSLFFCLPIVLFLLPWQANAEENSILATQPELSESALPPPQTVPHPQFSDEIASPSTDQLTFAFHGYARMPLRMHGPLISPRPPYLVDDNYYLSGFSYTRINETEWAEFFLSAQYKKTRIVIGLFSSQFSDWSETTMQGQGGIATAFVEQELQLGEPVLLNLRAGMFWDRNAYIPMYDTYLFGRMHMAGLRLNLRLWDLWHTKMVFGAHADVINANQGFTPVALLTTGVDLGWLDVSLFLGSTWTRDSKRQFAPIKDGTLKEVGGDIRLAIPHTGPIHLILAHYSAKNVLYLANAFEVLHSTGGRGLTENFFGQDGNGDILVGALDFNWETRRTFEKLFGADAGRAVRGLEVRLFGMLAKVGSVVKSDNPLNNYDNRLYLKWGIEPSYHLPFDRWSFLYFALRFDRVILDTKHESMAFRVITPRIGITPVSDFNLDIFLAYSRYFYGDNVRLRPNQIPGDLSVINADSDVLKLQVQASW